MPTINILQFEFFYFSLHDFELIHCRKTKCSECSECADGPVKLPCRHVLCLKCIVQRKEVELYYCPECEKQFPADFKVEVIANKK